MQCAFESSQNHPRLPPPGLQKNCLPQNHSGVKKVVNCCVKILSKYYRSVGLPMWLSGSKIHLKFRRHRRPGSGGAPGGRHSNPLQYSYLENPESRGAWKAIGCKESGTNEVTEQQLPHTQN